MMLHMFITYLERQVVCLNPFHKPPGRCGVLPCLDGNDYATFTTNPLYNGGIANYFRAWTSRALIWLFPRADLPITTKNAISSLSVASQAYLDCHNTSAIKYFSSVPYVLKMFGDDPSGMDLMHDTEIICVGGAVLPQSVGDMLVSKGVKYRLRVWQRRVRVSALLSSSVCVRQSMEIAACASSKLISPFRSSSGWIRAI